MAGAREHVGALDVRLLGGVVVSEPDGRLLDVGAAKSQVMLAALALSAGSAVPVTRLVDAVWGERPPRTAERTVQSYVARLRSALGASRITRSAGAYRLDVSPEAVDVFRFAAALDSGDVDGALAQWGGQPLAGLSAPGLQAEIAGLTERWLGAVEVDLAGRVESDPAGAVARLTELTAAHPLRESLWGLLMMALYRVGRQADALAAYQTARDGLGDALGVEPGPALREVHLRILRHDPQLGAGPLATAPGPRPLPTGTVTFVVIDVDGGPAAWASDRATMSGVMADHHAHVDELATTHGGTVFTRIGDSHGVAFETADQAWAMARELQAHGPLPTGETHTALRIALHTGEAQQHDRGYFGPAVHTAWRMAAVARGGQTIASAATAALLTDARVKDLGSHTLDDVVAEQHLVQLGEGDHPPLRSEDRHRGNLPPRINQVLGRQEELGRVRSALATHAFVTLVGPGGIGKTHLALTVAHAHATRDVWLIDLAGVTTGAEVARAAADALGITERQGRPITRSIMDALRTRRPLLVIDNCEHVVDAAADLVSSLTYECPQVRVLATSRERLGLTGERIITVPPLDPKGSAADLFCERARSLDATFDAVAERAVIEEICRRLDGIPLAVELAAARVSTLSPVDLLDRLERRFHVLDGTRRAGTERHRTLWSAIQWSYELLAPVEREVFGRLSMFIGAFDLAAAEWVAGGPESDTVEVANTLGRLTEQSLVTSAPGPFGRTFRLLEPIRQFARERLDDTGNAELVAERHARWCWCEVTGVRDLLSGWGEIEGVARLTQLWPNLRAAFEWACATGRLALATDLLTAVLPEIVMRSNNEVGDWAERLLRVTPTADVRTRTMALYAAAHRYSMTQDPGGYLRLLADGGEPEGVLMRHARATATEDHALMADVARDAAHEFRSRGDQHLAERAEINLATAWLNLGELTRADQRLQQLLDRYRRQGPPTFVNWTLLLLGYSALFQEHRESADHYFSEGVGIELPPRTHTPSEPLKAGAAFRRGEHARAFRLLRDHIDELLETDNMQAGTMDSIEFIAMMTATGRMDDAANVLAHLEAGHLFDGPGWRLLVFDAASRIAQHGTTNTISPITDDRTALQFMKNALDDTLASHSGRQNRPLVDSG